MEFKFSATKRDVKGTGASRRLRRAGTTPAIIYGGTGEPVQISLDHNELFHSLRKEAFHASVLNIDVEGTNEKVILRNTQWHPFKQLVLHVDFQRVDATHKLHIKVPLHFLNEDTAPGVKLGGGIVTHVRTELDVECLAANLPEFLEADVGALEAGQSLHVSQLTLPAGVTVLHAEGDPVVASVIVPRGAIAAAADEETPEA